VGGFFFDFEAVLSTQVADDAVGAARMLRRFSGRICGLDDVVAVGAAVEIVEDIIKTCEAAALGAYFSVLLYLHEKEDGTIDLSPKGGGVIISWLREQGYKVDVSDVREKIEIAANNGQKVDRLNIRRIIKENPTKTYTLGIFANAVNGKDWQDGKYSHQLTCKVRADDLRLGSYHSSKIRNVPEALLTTELALVLTYLKTAHCSSISSGPVDLAHADAGAKCAIMETGAFGADGSKPATLRGMTGAAMVLLDDQDVVVAMSERRMTEDGPSAYSKYQPPLVPVVGAPEGFYTAEPLAQNLDELAAVVKTLPKITDLVLTTSLTTGPKTFLADYIDKYRLDLQNVEKTNYELNHAVHYERLAAAEAAVELDDGAAFVLKASADIGKFDTPRNDEERRSALSCVFWRNPPKYYMTDALVDQGSSGLDAAASRGLLFSPVTRVAVDLVVITTESDRYLADTNGRPIKLNIKNEMTMREQNRVVYDEYLAAVIARGPGALADPTLRAQYAVYEYVDKAMPPTIAKKGPTNQQRIKWEAEWEAGKHKEWVVRPRVAAAPIPQSLPY